MKIFEGNVYSHIYHAVIDKNVKDCVYYALSIESMSDSELYDDAKTATNTELLFFTDMYHSMSDTGMSAVIHELAQRYGLSVDVVKTLAKVMD